MLAWPKDADMSLHQANTALTRNKSLRVPKSSLTAPQSSTVITTSTNIPNTRSHVSLFLTTLRLLDLDHESDWPDISPLTFSTKDAVAGQKKRIQCVEWALYHLFVLWDDDEARKKLKPFYPPLDQVQSINLRAALLRGLEQAKRNGILGRDAVVRKTMLDECKGERFEEVLAVFSSAVLKKLVAERALNSGPEYRPTTSEKIALENWGYSGERTELNGLILAHRASLGSTLADKNAARERYRDFEELLALKERSTSRRKEHIRASIEQHRDCDVSAQLKKQIRQVMKTSWTGNDLWLESILYDDTGSRQTGLLATDFGEVWNGVRDGRLSDLEDKSAGLLEQLDQRVRLQRTRLEKWQGFRQRIFGGPAPGSVDQEAKAKGHNRGIDLGFKAHQKLQPGAGQSGVVDNPTLPNAPPEYAQLLESMRTELGDIGKPRIPDFSKLASAASARQPSQSLAVPSVTTEPISDLSEWEDEPEEHSKQIPKIAAMPSAKPLRGLSRQESRTRSPKRLPGIRQQSRDEQGVVEDKASNLTRQGRYQHSALPLRPTSIEREAPATEAEKYEDLDNHATDSDLLLERETLSTFTLPDHLPRPRTEREAAPMPPPPRPISPTQAMADQILASMSNASPSPAKKPRHTLSLAERTRMSMTRTKSFDPDDDLDLDSNLLSPPLANGIRTKTKSEAATRTSVAHSSTGEEYEDLVARTRRSMAGFEAAKQKAQLERRRSQRKSKMAPQRKDSYFPRVAEESNAAAGGDTSVIDELLDAGPEDMDAVFKSRSKIRTSPVPSPSRRWDEEDKEL
ncbi:HAUS augmin-like complex subunit 6 N-terminus-domain-containing protein [Xylariales sp. AK1849]|nr:HAUS augmin-like complex subunit 6 N-terminus-domain-containing protein [Xylariales sp. AK1849]